MTGGGAAAQDVLQRVLAVERTHGFRVADRARVASELQSLARAAGDEGTALRAGLLLAEPVCADGDVARAASMAAAAAHHARTTGDAELLARSHHTHAVLFWHTGDRPEGAWHAVRSVEVLPEGSPAWLRALHLICLAGLVDGDAGAFDTVIAEVLSITAAGGHVHLELSALNNLAWRAVQDGRVEEALGVVQRMRQLSGSTGIQLRSADLDTAATVELAAGMLDEAWSTISQALAPDAPDCGPLAAAEAMVTAFEVLVARGQPDAALAQLEAARHLATEAHLPDALAWVEEARSAHLAATGDWEGAYQALLHFHRQESRRHARQHAERAALAVARYDAESTRRERDAFRTLAYTDPLTGLPNRRAVEEHATGVVAAADPVAVAVVDVDHFKRVDDEHSHDAGDAVLRGLGEVLRAHAAATPGTFTGRLGGEEFVVVWTGWSATAVAAWAEALRAEVASRSWHGSAEGVTVTTSIGWASSDEDASTWHDLLRRADARLYEAKRTGRDRVVGWSAPAREVAGPRLR